MDAAAVKLAPPKRDTEPIIGVMLVVSLFSSFMEVVIASVKGWKFLIMIYIIDNFISIVALLPITKDVRFNNDTIMITIRGYDNNVFILITLSLNSFFIALPIVNDAQLSFSSISSVLIISSISDGI